MTEIRNGQSKLSYSPFSGTRQNCALFLPMKLNLTKVCQINRFPHDLHEFDKTLLNLTVSNTGSSIGQYFFQNHRFRAKK